MGVIVLLRHSNRSILVGRRLAGIPAAARLSLTRRITDVLNGRSKVNRESLGISGARQELVNTRQPLLYPYQHLLTSIGSDG